MSVTLRDVVLAVRYGDAALVAETAGYLVLGASDLALDVPRKVGLDSLTLHAEGRLTLDASAVPFSEAERDLRYLLGQLLTLVRTPCPNLERVAARPELRGLPSLVRELEAALVPANRKAARRSLARLLRETRKSIDRGRSAMVIEEASPRPDETAALLENSTQFEEVGHHCDMSAGLDSIPAAASLSSEAVEDTLAFRRELAQAEPSLPPSLLSASAEVPAHRTDHSQSPVVSAPGSSSVQAGGEGPIPQSAPAAVQVVGTAGTRGFRITSRPLPPVRVEKLAWQTEVVTFAESSTDDSHTDLTPTEVYAKVAPVRGGNQEAAGISHESSPVELGARSWDSWTKDSRLPWDDALQSESSATALARRQRRVPEGVSLIPMTAHPGFRRPQPVLELLDGMTPSSRADDQLYARLKQLSQVELSPLAPPVGCSWMKS